MKSMFVAGVNGIAATMRESFCQAGASRTGALVGAAMYETREGIGRNIQVIIQAR